MRRLALFALAALVATILLIAPPSGAVRLPCEEPPSESNPNPCGPGGEVACEVSYTSCEYPHPQIIRWMYCGDAETFDHLLGGMCKSTFYSCNPPECH